METRVKPTVHYFSTRQKRSGKSKATPLQIVGLRLVDLATIFRSRYGLTLPDDDAGRDDITLAVDHLAALAHPKKHITQWLDLWAPWLTLAERKQIIAEGMTNRRNWSADQLAWRLRLMKEERTVLGITTIGAIDFPKAARKKRRKDRERQRKATQRVRAGSKPRAEYLSQSKQRTKPWIAEGISRATWFRRRLRETAQARETTPVTA